MYGISKNSWGAEQHLLYFGNVITHSSNWDRHDSYICIYKQITLHFILEYCNWDYSVLASKDFLLLISFYYYKLGCITFEYWTKHFYILCNEHYC